MSKTSTIKIIGFFFLSCLLKSCANTSSNKSTQTRQFEFSKLSITQSKPNGNKNWALDSPEAYYDNQKRKVSAKNAIGYIFQEDKKAFKINSNTVNVNNDGYNLPHQF